MHSTVLVIFGFLLPLVSCSLIKLAETLALVLASNHVMNSTYQLGPAEVWASILIFHTLLSVLAIHAMAHALAA